MHISLQQLTDVHVISKPKAEERLQQDLELGERGGDGLIGGEEEEEGGRPMKKSRAQKRKVTDSDQVIGNICQWLGNNNFN